MLACADGIPKFSTYWNAKTCTRDTANNSQEIAHGNATQNAYLCIIKNCSGLTNFLQNAESWMFNLFAGCRMMSSQGRGRSSSSLDIKWRIYMSHFIYVIRHMIDMTPNFEFSAKNFRIPCVELSKVGQEKR